MTAFKIKRQSLTQQISAATPDTDVLTRISSALRRLATAASGNFGSDCYVHAAIAQALLARLGVESRLVGGFAAWRVGNGNSDVIMHAPMPNMPPQPNAVAYHVWLEVGGNILDFTTYQLRAKAAYLDALDGGSTNVTWNPDFLFVRKSAVSPIQRVIRLHAGLYSYTRKPDIEVRIIAAASPLDANDVETAWLLYQNQELTVFGPNQIRDRILQVR